MDGAGLIILGATTLDEEEVGWDEDEEDQSDAEKLKPAAEPISTTSTAVPVAPATSTGTSIEKENLPGPKSSIDRESQPDSELSYDVVSKTLSQAAGSSTVAKVNFPSVISLRFNISVLLTEVSRCPVGVAKKRMRMGTT